MKAKTVSGGVGWVVWLVLALSAPARVWGAGEAGQPLVRWWNPEDYRAHQQVWQCEQTPDGVMWFGNSHSVLRYDGERWMRIEVPTSFVRAIAAGPDGKLWVGGTDEVGVVEAGADGLPAYRSLIDRLPEADREPGVVWSVAVHGGVVFYATESRVLRWDGKKFAVWHFENKPRQMLQETGGELFLHRQGVGLFRWDGKDFAAETADARWAATPGVRLAALDGGGWLVLTGDGTLWRWREGRVETFATDAAAAVAALKPRWITRLSDGGYAIGGRRGVLWLDRAGNFAGRMDQTNGLGNEFIFGMGVDREGGLWVGTDHGLGRISLGNGVTVFGPGQGLPTMLATAMTRHRGELLVAHFDGVRRLVPADPATGTMARFEKVLEMRAYVWALLSRPGGLLIGTGDGVWWQADGTKEPVQVLAAKQGVGVLGASVADPARVWVGTFNGLRVLRRGADGVWTEEKGWPDFQTEVRTLAEAGDGTLWIGTPTRGYGRILPGAGGAPGRTVEFLAEEAGLRPDHGWCHVYRDGRGEPIFVTDTGTYRFSGDTGRFAIAGDLQIAGRSDRTQLWPLTVTGDGSCWAQADTENSDWPRIIGRLDPGAAGDARWRPLPRVAVEAGGYGGVRAMYWESGDERLWLAGAGVVVAVDPGETRAEAPPAVAIARAVLPDGRETGAPPGGGGWRHAYARAPLTIEFAAPEYGAGPGRQYRWRMLGYDEDWSPWEAEAKAVFTNLRGGGYGFEVQARDPDGRETAVTHVALAVTPPWWRGPGAWVGYVLAAIAAGWLAMRWRMAALARRAARLERVVEARTAELAAARDAAEAAGRAKSEFVAGISHELRHPLQVILGQAGLLQGDGASAQARERGAAIEAGGRRLLRLIEDVLDVARLDARRLSLRPGPCDVGRLLGRVEAAHGPAAAARGLAWRVEGAAELAGAELVVDAERLGQILDNLIGNALKFTERGGVTLRAGTGPGTTWFEVADTGPGIEGADTERIFGAFEQGAAGRGAGGVGLGLAISRGLATMMGGTLTVTSEPGRGSRFRLTLPWVPAERAEGAGAEATRAEDEQLAGLRSAAGCGDLAQVRRELERLRGRPELGTLVAELEALAARFQLAGVRRVLARQA